MPLNKDEIMKNTLDAIMKKMPGELVGKYADMKKRMDVEVLSTGSMALDEMLGGGIAKGRLVEIVGRASSGKTTLALCTIAELQRTKPDSVIMYIDAENALDPKYMRQLGIDMDKIYLFQPSTGEQAYDAAYMFIASGIADLVVLDSIPAMIPEAMLDYELNEQPKIGMGATLDTRGMSRLVGATKKYGGTVIAINQYKDKVTIGMPTQGDGFSGNGYLPGGTSIPFMFSQVIKIQRIAKIFEGDTVIGDQIRGWAIKNKISAPYTTADYYLGYGRGIDLSAEIIEYGDKYGFVGRTARTYWIIDREATDEARKLDPEAEEIIVEGSRATSRQKFIEFLDDNAEIKEKLISEIRVRIRQEIEDADPANEAVEEEKSMGLDKEG